jgi:hypothetical protein
MMAIVRGGIISTMTTTSSIQLGSLLILIAMLGYASTIANVHATVDGISCNPSCTFQDNADGTTTWKDNNIASSKADSAAVANSNNNVKCFAFCAGSSTVSAGSAATSNANSPTNTQTVTKTKSSTTHDLVDRSNVIDTMPSLQRIKPTATECIDNTGSVNDQGYAQGYVDGNRDSVGLNGHDFDNSLHGKHTQEFRTGYQDGFRDGKSGINKNPC